MGTIPNAYDVDLDSKWWQGYDGEETIIIDEFRCDMKYGFLLKLFDSKPLKLQIKHSYGQFRSKRIVITTNIPPHKWYQKKTDEEIQPLRRRLREFAKIYRFSDLTEDGPQYEEEELKPREPRLSFRMPEGD